MNIEKHNKRICRRYIRQIKLFFPLYGRIEKNFIRNLNPLDVCSDTIPVPMNDLYNKCGRPDAVFQSYISVIQTKELVRQIQITRIFKRFAVALCVCATIALCAGIFQVWNDYKVYKDAYDSSGGYFTEEIEIQE